MIFKREFTSHNATVIEPEFEILIGLLIYIDIIKYDQIKKRKKEFTYP